MLGGKEVGKSSLIQRYVNDTYTGYPGSSVDDQIKKISVDNKIVSLKIYDTISYHNSYQTIQRDYPGTHAVILNFDLT